MIYVTQQDNIGPNCAPVYAKLWAIGYIDEAKRIQAGFGNRCLSKDGFLQTDSYFMVSRQINISNKSLQDRFSLKKDLNTDISISLKIYISRPIDTSRYIFIQRCLNRKIDKQKDRKS